MMTVVTPVRGSQYLLVRPCFSKILSFWPLKGLLPLRQYPSAANLRRRASAAIYGFCPVNSPGASMKADVMPQQKGYETLMALTSSLITAANLFVGNRDPTHRHLRFSHTQLPVRQNPQSRDADFKKDSTAGLTAESMQG